MTQWGELENLIPNAFCSTSLLQKIKESIKWFGYHLSTRVFSIFMISESAPSQIFDFKIKILNVTTQNGKAFLVGTIKNKILEWSAKAMGNEIKDVEGRVKEWKFSRTFNIEVFRCLWES